MSEFMAEIIFINPRFEISYWGLEYALPLLGKKANMPLAALPLLAALTPSGHSVTLLDENIETIDFDRCARADIVGLTGMVVQRGRMRQIITELKRRAPSWWWEGRGPLSRKTISPGLSTRSSSVRRKRPGPGSWKTGSVANTRSTTSKPDEPTCPRSRPRYDLLKMRDYLFGNIQFSRGCPFQCEFCDIIVTFGRKPRIKTSRQILAELDALLRLGVRGTMIVDDNLIGNKKAIRPVLLDLIAWQKRLGYPMTFFTEASIDLADEPELMELMVEANIVNVFVGVESPNPASLRETKKFQNVRSGGTLVEKVKRIQDAGMEVMCGMILGFDNDDETIFEAQVQFIAQARVINVMLGMLSAIPKTPLYDRMVREGRLDPAGEPEFGTNIVPLRLGRDQLRNGFVHVLSSLNDTGAYFERLEALYLDGRLDFSRGANRYWRCHPWHSAKARGLILAQAVALLARIAWKVNDGALRREYLRRIWRLVKARPDPSILWISVVKTALHYHVHTMAGRMSTGESHVYNTY